MNPKNLPALSDLHSAQTKQVQQPLSPELIAALKQQVYDIIGCAIAVHQEMGPGLNEYMYQEALAIALRQANIPFEREKAFRVMFRGEEIHHEHRLDFLVRDSVIVECKAVETLIDVHRQQLWNYMRLTKTELGILYNFAPPHDQCERYYLNLQTQRISAF